jgi:integrase/recombinase XerD
MATDFAVFLRRFLNAHLAELRGCSPNTVASYRDTFKLLIVFFRDNRSIPPENSPSTASTPPPSPGS